MMPELDNMRAGDELNLSRFPNLKHIVQTGFTKMRGVNMYKDVAVYANPAMSTYQIPRNSDDAVTHICLHNGKETNSYTSGQLVKSSEDLWQNNLRASAEGVHQE